MQILKLPFSGDGRGIGGSVKFIGGSTGGSFTSGSSSISDSKIKNFNVYSSNEYIKSMLINKSR